MDCPTHYNYNYAVMLPAGGGLERSLLGSLDIVCTPFLKVLAGRLAHARSFGYCDFFDHTE
jgi:hypothetical protein